MFAERFREGWQKQIAYLTTKSKYGCSHNSGIIHWATKATYSK